MYVAALASIWFAPPRRAAAFYTRRCAAPRRHAGRARAAARRRPARARMAALARDQRRRARGMSSWRAALCIFLSSCRTRGAVLRIISFINRCAPPACSSRVCARCSPMAQGARHGGGRRRAISCMSSGHVRRARLQLSVWNGDEMTTSSYFCIFLQGAHHRRARRGRADGANISARVGHRSFLLISNKLCMNELIYENIYLYFYISVSVYTPVLYVYLYPFFTP